MSENTTSATKTAIPIAKAEHGVIRVFAISRPMADMARALKQHPKAAVASDLLNHTLSPDDFELFALSDLTGVGLPRYLSDGYDVDREAIRADTSRLEGLDGYVLLLFSGVSNDGDLVLHPAHDLTLIGTYAEPKALHAAPPIVTDAAKPYSGVQPDHQAPRRSRIGSAVVAAAALFALLLIWWIFR